MGIFFGLLFVALALGSGLDEIAQAIQSRKKCSECGD